MKTYVWVEVQRHAYLTSLRHFTRRKTASCSRVTGGCVTPRATVDPVDVAARITPRSHVRPSRSLDFMYNVKVKTIPLQAWTGP
jgi:hypothetical protein